VPSEGLRMIAQGQAPGDSDAPGRRRARARAAPIGE
jgi:hypothetical protein